MTVDELRKSLARLLRKGHVLREAEIKVARYDGHDGAIGLLSELAPVHGLNLECREGGAVVLVYALPTKEKAAKKTRKKRA